MKPNRAFYLVRNKVAPVIVLLILLLLLFLLLSFGSIGSKRWNILALSNGPTDSSFIVRQKLCCAASRY